MHRYLCVFGLLVAIVLTTCQDPPTVDADQPQESSFTNAKLKEQKDLEVEDPNDTVERRAFRRATNPLVDFSFIPGLALRRVRGQDSQDTTPTTLSGRFTQPECAQRCSRDPDCKAFQHNHKRSLCQLFSATLNYVHSTAYYERKLTAAEIAADERVLFASEVFDRHEPWHLLNLALLGRWTNQCNICPKLLKTSTRNMPSSYIQLRKRK